MRLPGFIKMRDAVRRLMRILFHLAIIACAVTDAGAQERTSTVIQSATQAPGPSGLPIPRFVSLKADRVNVRKGPSTTHNVTWIFRRLGLPVEIIAESERWRRIRDAEGVDGWIFQSLLSGRRTALIMPWAKSKESAPQDNPTSVSLYEKHSASANVIANMEPGVLVDIKDCDGDWCLVTIDGYRGWVEQDKLWGVYQGESVK